MAIFTFEPGQSEVFTMTHTNGDRVESDRRTLSTDKQWQEWLDEKTMAPAHESLGSINLILSLGAKTNLADPANLSVMPFSESTFRRIVDGLFVHGSIARVISRSTSCTFSWRPFSWGTRRLQSHVYNCRSSASWSGDRALSATFFPGSLATYAVMFGCDREQAEEVVARLLHGDEVVFHPMVLPTMFAEMERDRHIALVRDMTTSLAERVYNVGVGADDVRNVQSRNSSSIALWTQTSHLRDGLHAFKRQMKKMVEHLDDLTVTLLQPEGGTSTDTALERQNLRLRDSGARIRMRLRELVDEYDEYIQRCTTIMDGMSLATQLEWNNIGRQDAKINQKISNSNLTVANLARKDGRLMKSIAIVTMLFLPATFLATLFSTGFFDWKATKGSAATISPSIWIYVLLAMLLTLVTLGAWYVYIIWHGKVDAESKTKLDA